MVFQCGKQLSFLPLLSSYLVVSKFYMGRIRDVLHQRIITIEQVPLDCHRGEGRVVKLFRQPETKQDRIQSPESTAEFNQLAAVQTLTLRTLEAWWQWLSPTHSHQATRTASPGRRGWGTWSRTPSANAPPGPQDPQAWPGGSWCRRRSRRMTIRDTSTANTPSHRSCPPAQAQTKISRNEEEIR